MLGINTNYTQRSNQPNFGMTLKFSDEKTLKAGMKLLGDAFVPLVELEQNSKGKGYTKFITELVENKDLNPFTKAFFVLAKNDLLAFKKAGSLNRFVQFKCLLTNPWQVVKVSSKDVEKASTLLVRRTKLGQIGKKNILQELIFKKLNAKIEYLKSLKRNPVGNLLYASLPKTV